MDTTTVGVGVKYCVEWEDYPHKKDWTWELYEHFDNDDSRALLLAYHTAHPEKPVDPRVI